MIDADILKRDDGRYVREHLLRETCDCLLPHCHPYAHLTRCLVGSATLNLWRDENRNERISTQDFAAGDPAIEVPALVLHEWKAKEPGTVIECEVPSGELQRYGGPD